MSKALEQQLIITHTYLLFIGTLPVLLILSAIKSTWSTNYMYKFCKKLAFFKNNS